ncbi:hypothetical protein ONZ45_g6548 [Pleurotus djamor]|nr:hypothetical protein ONZ45_g6548 [Pleurotus djamor]
MSFQTTAMLLYVLLVEFLFAMYIHSFNILPNICARTRMTRPYINARLRIFSHVVSFFPSLIIVASAASSTLTRLYLLLSNDLRHSAPRGHCENIWTPSLLMEMELVGYNVDLDSMDPDIAILHTTSGESFGDMTSNQAIVYNEATRPEKKHLVQQAIGLAQSEGKENEQRLIDRALRILTVLLAKGVYPHLSGNVHAQTSPSAAYDTEETIREAEELVSLFGDHGIPKDRVCIKIPATPESLIACRSLADKGIQTLATCLFSLPQAAAASEANCIYVAPYFNVIASIVNYFKQIKSKTLVMPASIVTSDEVITLTRLAPDHLTLSPSVLRQLSEKTAVDLGSLEPTPSRGNAAPSLPGLLANNGQLLREALLKDKETARKLEDALKIFKEREDFTKAYIKSLL